MTMLNRILAWPWEPSPSRGQWQMADHRNSLDTPYIRSDLTNDLLAALETIHSQTNDGLARRIAGDALSDYRALAD